MILLKFGSDRVGSLGVSAIDVRTTKNAMYKVWDQKKTKIFFGSTFNINGLYTVLINIRKIFFSRSVQLTQATMYKVWDQKNKKLIFGSTYNINGLYTVLTNIRKIFFSRSDQLTQATMYKVWDQKKQK